MTVKQVSAHEIEISCTFNKGFAHGIFSTKQISLTVLSDGIEFGNAQTTNAR